MLSSYRNVDYDRFSSHWELGAKSIGRTACSIGIRVLFSGGFSWFSYDQRLGVQLLEDDKYNAMFDT
jgi:hypothetical protein